MQTGGADDEVVVEARLVRRRGGFVHSSAGRSGATQARHVRMTEGGVHVPANEVLTIDDAARIFETFLGDESLDASYAWRDRTAEFS